MTIPKLDGRPFKDLCGTGYRPLKLTGIIQMWLIQHFSDPNNIQLPGLSQYIWNADPEVSTIQIYPLEDWRPKETEKRPSLIIKRQELKFVRYGIDNRHLGSGLQNVDRRVYSAGLQGSHTVFCIGGESGEAEQLGAEVGQELMKFAPIVREWLAFLRVELVSIGELSKLEEASENFVVPVNLAYAFMEDWELLPLDDPKLTGIKLALGI